MRYVATVIAFFALSILMGMGLLGWLAAQFCGAVGFH
jgi:hypothetical protein